MTYENVVEWPMGRLDFSAGCIVMGVLNVTPDSFSDGGQFFDTDKAIGHGVQMVADGAAIIDVGGESTRPGSASVSADEQIKRVVPVIKALCRKIDVPISIDTYNYDVASAALEAGAAMINDITALSDERMAELAAEQQVPVVLMHMQGTPQTMQIEPKYDDVVGEVRQFLLERARRAEQFGIPKERIFIDPGIGFGKTLEHNLLILRNIRKFVETGYRVLIGTSRKGFIGKITGKENPSERIFGTAATVALCVAAGVSIIRVHDVAEMVDVVKVANVIGKNVMKQDWPGKKDREKFEINGFIKHYKKLRNGRRFEIVSRGPSDKAGPDYVVKDAVTGERFGVELVSVYLDNRSVPDVHKKSGHIEIPYEPHKIKEYKKYLLRAVAEKIRKSSKYDKRFPLILSVYVNEYVGIHMDEEDFQSLVEENETVFDEMTPFREIVFWSRSGRLIFSVKP